MSDTNRVGLRIKRSSALTIPVTLAPNELRALRMTAATSMGANPLTTASNEIRQDREVTDLSLVGIEAGGEVPFELSFGTFDEIIESAMFSTFVNTPNKVGATEIVSTAAGTITVDDDADFKIDHLVRISKVTRDLGEGVYFVTATAANVIDVTPFDANTNALDGTETVAADSELRVVGLIANAAGEVDIDVTGGVFSVIGPAGFFDDAMGAALPLVIGQWVKVQGTDAPLLNDVYGRITTVAATTITIDAPTGAVTEAVTGKAAVFFGDYVRNGVEAVANHQFAVEKRFEDHSPVTRELLLGQTISQLSLSLASQSIAEGNITFFGFNSNIDTVIANLYDGGTPTDIDAESFNIYNTSSNVGRIGLGADPVSAALKNYVLEATMNINNNLRRRTAVGELGAIGIGVGEFLVTGTLNTYFDDATFLTDLLANTERSYDVTVRNADGRSLTFDNPRIKFTSGVADVPGKNQDAVLPLGFQALRDSTLGYTMHVQRWHYTK